MFRKASRFLAAATCAALLLPCAAPAVLSAAAEACALESSEADTIPYSLIVCGTLISDCIPYHPDGQYALIPVVPMLEGLGISLDWQDDHTARFDLVLDTAAGTLVYADPPNVSLLLPAPGSKLPAVITTIDGVFMVDRDTLLLFFQQNGIYCYCYDADCTVEIGFREEATTPSA